MTATDSDQPWPPLVIDGVMSRAILVRDIMLTLIMWLLFILLTLGEVDRIFGRWLEPHGLRPFFRDAGFKEWQRNWAYFLYMLAPYLGLALLLAMWLVSLSMGLFRGRPRAIVQRRPDLSLGVEARHAKLGLRTAAVGEEMLNHRAKLIDIETIDAMGLLTILRGLDEAALIDARQLKVTRVHLTREGQYQILLEA